MISAQAVGLLPARRLDSREIFAEQNIKFLPASPGGRHGWIISPGEKPLGYPLPMRLCT
jgi:hypothetical protein